jgi:hypothetical protein
MAERVLVRELVPVDERDPADPSEGQTECDMPADSSAPDDEGPTFAEPKLGSASWQNMGSLATVQHDGGWRNGCRPSEKGMAASEAAERYPDQDRAP